MDTKLTEFKLENPDKKILLIEDDPIFSQLINKLANNQGIKVISTPYGNQALELIQKEAKFDLILVDLGLPDINGIELISKIYLIIQHIPILVISVISSEQSLLSAIQAGARGYVLKDDSEKALMNSIIEAIKGNYPISPMLARYLFKLAKQETKVLISDTMSVKLTKQEIKVLEEISNGKSYEEISKILEVSLSTIQTHIRNLYKKLNVHSQTQALLKAKTIGLL